MQKHLHFIPESEVPITLASDRNNPSEKDEMKVLIPLKVDQITASITPEYNLAYDDRVLILRFKITCDKDTNNSHNMKFCCFTIKNAYHNDEIDMIVLQTLIINDITPPQDITLQNYPRWTKFSPVFTIGKDNIPKYNDDSIEPNTELKVGSGNNDSCTIPPKP